MDASLGNSLGLWLVVPFAGMLLAIALLPSLAPRWVAHDRNLGLVAAAFGVPVVAYLLVRHGNQGAQAVGDLAHEYVSFMMLLAALYTVAGGIFLRGDLLATPRTNVIMLAIGAVLANVVGTTGAAMLLVFPLVRSNSERRHARHVIPFFIFIVCNIGGLLVPLGPPLVLGFLRGVPFWWTLRLLPEWLFVTGLTLAIFYVLDRRAWARETPEDKARDREAYEPLSLEGRVNLLFLAAVVALLALSEPLNAAGEAIHFPFVREVALGIVLLLSLRFGPRRARIDNGFAWHPLTEVAIAFAGVFATMVPVLAILEARGAELGLTQPWQYFWTTGGLSAVLDNAPTYLTFGAAAQGLTGVTDTHGLTSTVTIASLGHAPAAYLAAISCGAVFMGALSYIGNAPNFMVRSVAEHNGIAMPHFFRFMGYACLVLLPVFAVTTVLFFR